MCITRTYDGFKFAETVPIVIVFTKYDRLVWSMKRELEEDDVNLGPEDLDKRAREEAQKVLDNITKFLKNASGRLGLKEQTMSHAYVSGIDSFASLL